jgi:hypothetical protein
MEIIKVNKEKLIDCLEKVIKQEEVFMSKIDENWLPRTYFCSKGSWALAKDLLEKIKNDEFSS